MIKLTHAILDAGMSSNGGWSDKQIDLLGVSRFKNPRWREQVIGRSYHPHVIDEFLTLRDAHLKITLRQKYPVVQCYVAKGMPSQEIRDECPFPLISENIYKRVLK